MAESILAVLRVETLFTGDGKVFIGTKIEEYKTCISLTVSVHRIQNFGVST